MLSEILMGWLKFGPVTMESISWAKAAACILWMRRGPFVPVCIK